MYSLTAQIRRAAASVPANIAEGYGRESTASYIQFLKIARGSLKEFETHILLAERVGLLEPRATALLLTNADNVGRMLNALTKALSRQ